MLVQFSIFSRLLALHGLEKTEVSEEASIEELLNQLYTSVPSVPSHI
jgi:hypothetical protein